MLSLLWPKTLHLHLHVPLTLPWTTFPLIINYSSFNVYNLKRRKALIKSEMLTFQNQVELKAIQFLFSKNSISADTALCLIFVNLCNTHCNAKKTFKFYYSFLLTHLVFFLSSESLIKIKTRRNHLSSLSYVYDSSFLIYIYF